MFLVWANLHIQFFSGLCALALFELAELATPILVRLGIRGDESPGTRRPLTVGALLGSCLAASLVTPYSFRLFSELLNDAYSKASFKYFIEMQPMGFRQARDYLLAFVVMAAFLALGRQRSRNLFQLSLLITGTLLAFRITRDGWCALLPAIAVLGEGFGSGRASRRWVKYLPVACAVAAVIAAASGFLCSSNRILSKLSEKFPVGAADFINSNHLPKPLFNSYAWGGFLTWYLPEYPVYIDGRVSLHGEAFLDHYYELMSGGQRLELDPVFANSGTILLERQCALTRALTTIPSLSAQYRVLYSDSLAVVIVPSSDGRAP
jgi:hypothetical protein